MRRLRWTALACTAGMIVLLGGCYGGGAPAENATPIISNVFPSNVTAGSDGFTLFVQGTEFVSTSKGASFAYWNGLPRSSTFNATTGQLQVSIPASDVANPGLAQVKVFSPAPGGGFSSTLSFTIVAQQAGAPVISATTPFSPSSVAAGGTSFTLTVNGSNFSVNDLVTWNGGVRTTTYLTASQVTAAITQTDIATAGSGSVAVSTPGQVVASPSITFPITGANNPSPSVSSVTPSSVTAGGPDVEVLLQGSSFVTSSAAAWGATQLATAFIDSSHLMVMIPSSETATGATANITVTNPAPGGGTSGGTPFAVK